MITDMKTNIIKKGWMIACGAFFVLQASLFTSCMDKDWDEPSQQTGLESYGNKYIQETNVKTIAELKALFSNEINQNGLKQVKTPMQIKALVVGNDEGGNIYNGIYLQDETGAIGVSISQSGLAGAFCVGQMVLVELEGLYIGGYGKQGQIGTTYTNPNKEGATPQVGRMSRYIWQNHYRLLASAGSGIVPIEVKWNLNSLDLAADCGKLITLKGVTLAEADGKTVFAPNDGSATVVGGSVNRVISGLSNVVLRTSTYAKFANKIMPTDRIDITGIATRYNDTWQLLMRVESDIKPSSTEPAPVATPNGSGTESDPYNVAGVTQFTKSLAADKESGTVYAKGYIVKVSEIDTTGTYGNATYLISDQKDGSTGTFQVYRGFGVNGQKFNTPGATIIKEGQEVVVKGKVINYKGNTLQFAQGSTIVSLK